ncbi:MAG: hypothetical protein ACETWM_13245 [Candidatus Lokiarchaeia archaeon]
MSSSRKDDVSNAWSLEARCVHRWLMLRKKGALTIIGGGEMGAAAEMYGKVKVFLSYLPQEERCWKYYLVSNFL